MSRRSRVAVGSLFTECNDFVARPATLADFERQQLSRGPSVFDIKEGTVGGVLARLQAGSADVVPLLVASACPRGQAERRMLPIAQREASGRSVQGNAA